MHTNERMATTYHISFLVITI